MHIRVCIAHSHCLANAKFVVSNNARQITPRTVRREARCAPPRPPVLPCAATGAPPAPGSTRSRRHPASLPFSPSPAAKQAHAAVRFSRRGPPLLLGTSARLPSTSLDLALQPHHPQIQQPREGLPGLGANGGVVGDGLEEDEELGLEAQRLGGWGWRGGRRARARRARRGGTGTGRWGRGPEHARDTAPRGDDRAEEVRGEPRVGAAAEAEERRARGLKLREEEVVRRHAREERGLPLRRSNGEESPRAARALVITMRRRAWRCARGDRSGSGFAAQGSRSWLSLSSRRVRPTAEVAAELELETREVAAELELEHATPVPPLGR
ncbi:hypothetical protein PVAP13_5KG155307 [Panicum virgatum]|uniref:Uncharacterized protein n=1 Tax=Panicum virgatum TaxID=38727 RepID=A0A8T0SH95_PANVG|nr:hypothetical protein PVAP13_5KG155307 [Panicum virgatum]